MNIFTGWIEKIKGFFWRLSRWKIEKPKKPPKKYGRSLSRTISAIDLACVANVRCRILDKSLKVHSRRHPDIRVSTVKSFGDAYRFLIRMCDQRLLTWHYGGGYYYYIVTLPGNQGQLILTDKVGYLRDGTIAILKIDVAAILPQIKEIRFRITE